MRATAGAYYWAGPGTVRMIELKFFRPRVDVRSHLKAYDADVLRRLKDALDLSDAWVTYSWGFSDTTETEDRAFLREKLPNFRRLGIRTHAYVQGMNLVEADHTQSDYWCRDDRGARIPYHRGRKLCCPGNPAFQEFLLKRVDAACREDVDGVFIDNLHFGQFPVPVGEYLTSFGCHCDACRSGFRATTGEDIPAVHRPGDPLTEAYICYRTDTLHALVAKLRHVTAAHGKLFGSNGLDLTLNPALFYGYDVDRLAAQQDYLLVENFNHPLSKGGNERLKPVIERVKKPVFVVSYKTVIGKHAACRQKDLDAVHTESSKVGYVPCYKASEFTTDGVWHDIRSEHVRRPQAVALPTTRIRKPARLPVPMARRVHGLVNRIDGPFLERVYERKRYRFLLGWVVDGITMRTFPWKGAAAGAARTVLRWSRLHRPNAAPGRDHPVHSER